jgi:hypothetical protein
MPDLPQDRIARLDALVRRLREQADQLQRDLENAQREARERIGADGTLKPPTPEELG